MVSVALRWHSLQYTAVARGSLQPFSPVLGCGKGLAPLVMSWHQRALSHSQRFAYSPLSALGPAPIACAPHLARARAPCPRAHRPCTALAKKLISWKSDSYLFLFFFPSFPVFPPFT